MKKIWKMMMFNFIKYNKNKMFIKEDNKMAKATKTTKKAETKAAKKEVKTPEVLSTFTTESLARAMAAKTEGAARKYGISECQEIINVMKECVGEALAAGQKVQLTGFISITPTYRDERVGNNVLTGEQMTIPAAVAFTAKVGKGLKDIAKELPDNIVAAVKSAKAEK